MAFDMANLISFPVHELLVDRLLEEYLHEPPTGFARGGLDQLMRADREIFRRLAEETRSGIAVDETGRLPLEATLKAVINEPAVKLFLLPVPTSRA
eukprot:12195329-Heterocapsa_arctica.AAC.1